MAIRILLADDEARWRMITKDFLEHEGYEVLEAENGAEALMLLRRNPDVALVILDVMMPMMDGVAVCRAIRDFSDVPVLIVTAREDEQTEMDVFNCGADQFVYKPVRMRALMARVHALLKRSEQVREELNLGPLTVHYSARSVTNANGRIPLTPKEYDLLVYLANNRNVAKSREEILSAVWNTEFYGDARTVDTHVKNLRMKLGEAGNLIRTVRSRGYILEYEL